MGVFDRFKKKAQAAPPEEAEQDTLAYYAGMRVEVTAQDDRLLFVAKLMYPGRDTAELHQYSETELDMKQEDGEPLPVKIRGYNDGERKAVYMEGVIHPQPRHIWRVEELQVMKQGNDRAFFRLDTDLEASMTVFSGLNAGERECRMKNISIGGACVAVDRVLHPGDKFLLNVKLLDDRPVSAMVCQVMRVTERENGKFEYGCRFLELTEEDQDRIAQSIFDAQRKQRAGK